MNFGEEEVVTLSKPKLDLEIGIKYEPHPIEMMIAKRLKRHNDKNQVEEDKVTNGDYLRVSSISGGCLRKAYYQRTVPDKSNPVEFSAKDVLRTTMGNKYHDLLQDILEDDLINVEKRYFDHENKITGKIDGMFKSNNAIFEIKTCGLAKFNYIVRNNTPTIAHIHQVHWYMHMTGARKAFILYVNRNVEMFFSSIDEFSFFSVKQMEKRWSSMGYPEIFKVFKVDYDENVFQSQKKIIDNYHERIKNFYDKKNPKDKPPPKIPETKGICNSCSFLNYCRENIP